MVSVVLYNSQILTPPTSNRGNQNFTSGNPGEGPGPAQGFFLLVKVPGRTEDPAGSQSFRTPAECVIRSGLCQQDGSRHLLPEETGLHPSVTDLFPLEHEQKVNLTPSSRILPALRGSDGSTRGWPACPPGSWPQEGFLSSKCRIYFSWPLSITSGRSRTCLHKSQTPAVPPERLRSAARRTRQDGSVRVQRQKCWQSVSMFL